MALMSDNDILGGGDTDAVATDTSRFGLLRSTRNLPERKSYLSNPKQKRSLTDGSLHRREAIRSSLFKALDQDDTSTTCDILSDDEGELPCGGASTLKGGSTPRRSSKLDEGKIKIHSQSKLRGKKSDLVGIKQDIRRNSVTKLSLQTTGGQSAPRNELETQPCAKDKHQEKEVDYGYNTDDAASVTSMPPLSSSAFRDSLKPPRGEKYRRRNSVTKFSLDGSQNTTNDTYATNGNRKEESEVDYGYNTDDGASVASMPPLSSSAFRDSQKPPRGEKYRRRNSVTKFSLQGSQNTMNGNHKEESEVDYGYNTDDGASVASMPPLSSSAFRDSLKPPRAEKYRRRNSVTKFSLQGSQNATNDNGNHRVETEVDYGYNTDDGASVASMPPLSSSAFRDSQKPPRAEKYRRRNSVTKFSLQGSQNVTNNTYATNGNHQQESEVDYGYNTDDAASVASMPPLSSSAFRDSHKPPREKYKRRNSVTKFSLQGSQTTKKESYANGNHQEENLATASSVATDNNLGYAYNNGDNNSDSDSDGDTAARSLASKLPVDKNNREETRRALRRSIRILDGLDDGSDEENHFDKNGSKRPSLSPDNKKSISQTPSDSVGLSPSTNRRKHELENDSTHVRKRNLLNATENANVTKKPSPNRSGSMSSMESDDNSDAEFESESVVLNSYSSSQRPPKPPRFPPRLPPSSSPSLSSFFESNQRNQHVSLVDKTTVDVATPGGGNVDESGSVHHGEDGLSGSRKSNTRRRTSIVGVPADVRSDNHDQGHDGETTSRDPLGGSRRSKLRASRTSIVGVSCMPDDVSSHAGSEDEHNESIPSKKGKTRARRTSIIGIPGAAVSSPTTPPSTESIEHDTAKPVRSHKKDILSKTTKIPAKSRSLPAHSFPTSIKKIGAPKGCLKTKPLERGNIPKCVRFGRLIIKEFPIILGDNPAVTSGAPVTIDWVPQSEMCFSVNAYEQCKPRRRRRGKLLISVSKRAILLLAAGYSIDEIADASMDAMGIKEQRLQTLENQAWDRMSLLMENTGALGGILLQPLQSTGKKLKSLVLKPQAQPHVEAARIA